MVASALEMRTIALELLDHNRFEAIEFRGASSIETGLMFSNRLITYQTTTHTVIIVRSEPPTTYALRLIFQKRVRQSVHRYGERRKRRHVASASGFEERRMWKPWQPGHVLIMIAWSIRR